ncbi:SMP-30/gluconolactonase/LRE family protein [Catenovulum maritimum]|uniref:Gluconolactonase n=1 Tax=Catenovulum maritimum TaxID=1513271 RepID=A0A0J8GYH8_9ALTE|nr:SMP-30/gluconolactonase/LRE family protein [Catenovulum maritimum]KMT66289.1 gluconolactonase [Catenovulum maritimum]
MSEINQFNQAIKRIGVQLTRPECVLTNAKGEVYVSDFGGGVTQIKSNGSQAFYGGEYPGFGVLQTNGFAMLADGSFLIAHLGQDKGGIFKLTRDNRITPFLLEINGKPLPPSNFVYLDHQGRIWITVSTQILPRADAYKASCNDGFIILVDQSGARVVAEGIGYTNECWVNPEGTELYVNATFSRELLKYNIHNNGDLSNQSLVTKFGAGTFPDGLTRDVQGNFWVTSIVSNRVIKITPDGEQEIMLEISNDQHINKTEIAFQTEIMGRPHLDNNPAPLKNISSLAFAGEKLNQILLGCLLDQQIYQLDTEFNGVKPAHWYF